MTLNGNVKFANGGFESWGLTDYISKDLGEPFLTNNSFTVVTTFKLSFSLYFNGPIKGRIFVTYDLLLFISKVYLLI